MPVFTLDLTTVASADVDPSDVLLALEASDDVDGAAVSYRTDTRELAATMSVVAVDEALARGLATAALVAAVRRAVPVPVTIETVARG